MCGVTLHPESASATIVHKFSFEGCAFSIQNYQDGSGYQAGLYARAWSEITSVPCGPWRVRLGNSANGFGPWVSSLEVNSLRVSAPPRLVTSAPQGAQWYSEHEFTSNWSRRCYRLYFGGIGSTGPCGEHQNATLHPGGRMQPGQSLWTGNGIALIMQGDGNLVLYAPGGIARWSSRTAGYPGAWVQMQSDGNLVVYRPGGVAIGNTRTYGRPGSILALQTDSNLVVYSSAWAPLWDRFSRPWYRIYA